MRGHVSVTQKGLFDFLLNVAPVRPVFVWGQPGIGKSSIVTQFAEAVGMPCVTMLGSQLAPEDIIGVPKIVGDRSVFCPPTAIARSEPYCLFLDELNACSHEVQKAFYSLINDHRLGEYELPAGSIVVGAGNRSQDSAIVRQMSSALINRMVHVHLQVDHRDWLEWAAAEQLHPWVLEYIRNRNDHLFSRPPKIEEPFSTPRTWHILSDCLKSYDEEVPEDIVATLAAGCLTPAHAVQFQAFVKQLRNRYGLHAILKGEQQWPSRPEDRDVLYFLAQSLREHLFKFLPAEKDDGAGARLAHTAKGLLRDLARINFEIAQMVAAEDEERGALPAWFMAEVVRDLPRLVAR